MLGNEERCPDCELDADEECLHCTDRVMCGVRACIQHDTDVHEAFREGADPMDDVRRTRVADDAGPEDGDDIGETLTIRDLP